MDNQNALIKEAQSLIIRMSAELEKEKQKNDLLLEERRELIPKSEFYDAVANSDFHCNMSEVAKVLNYPDMGRNKIFEFLRAEKILRANNEPYQQYVDSGYFRMVEQKVTLPYGETTINFKTVVSQKGVDFIRRKLNERFTNTED